jgi:hypothetical protein
VWVKKSYYSLRESSKLWNSSGITNLGLMARALVLKHNANSSEEENVKWQTLQVATMGIANSLGRISIGIYPSEAQPFSMQPNILLDRHNVGRFKTQGDKTCAARLSSGRILHRFPVGWPPHRRYRTPTIRGFLGRDFVWFNHWASSSHLNRMVRNEYVQLFASAGAAGTKLPSNFLPPSPGGCIAHVSGNAGLFFLSMLVVGNILSVSFGRIFDAHSSFGEHGMVCLEGARCYTAALYVSTLICVCALILAVVVAKRDQKYRYR